MSRCTIVGWAYWIHVAWRRRDNYFEIIFLILGLDFGVWTDQVAWNPEYLVSLHFMTVCSESVSYEFPDVAPLVIYGGDKVAFARGVLVFVAIEID